MVGTNAVEETAPRTIGTRWRDRRRPGRADHRNPALVALLRDAPNPPVEPDATDSAFALEAEDPLAPARGIVASIVISGLAWAVISGSIWLLFLLRG